MELVNPGIGLIFWQTVTFFIVLFLLSRYAWKPIMKGLKDREKNIEDALMEAERAKEEMKNIKAENQKMLEEAEAKGNELIKEAQAAAKQIREEAETRASEQAQKLIDDAQNAIQTERQAAVAEIKSQIAVLSVDIAEKILKDQLSDKDKQKKLAEDMIKDLQVN